MFSLPIIFLGKNSKIYNNITKESEHERKITHNFSTQ